MPERDGARLSPRERSLAYVLVSTLLFSFVGPIAKLVALDAGAISFFRALFATVTLAAVWPLLARRRASAPFRVWSRVDRSGSVQLRSALLHVLLGVLVSGNWYFYVLAVQVSTVAVAVVCLFTYPLLTSLVEPLFFRESYRIWDLVSGVAVLFGVGIVVERFSFSEASAVGALYGLVSALCLTLRNVLSRRAVRTQTPELVSMAQFAVASCVFLPSLFLLTGAPSVRDLLLLALIGGALTMVSQLLFMAALRHLSTTLASLVVSLQPLFAIAIAGALLGEVPGARTLIGGAVVLGAVVLALATNPSPPPLPVTPER